MNTCWLFGVKFNMTNATAGHYGKHMNTSDFTFPIFARQHVCPVSINITEQVGGSNPSETYYIVN